MTQGDTAAEFDSNLPPAASSPFVLGLAEVACHNAIKADLAAGDITVGVRSTLDHLLPSRIGAELVVKARLVRRNGRRLYFSVEVFDGDVVVARVKHMRAIVNADRMRARLSSQ